MTPRFPRRVAATLALAGLLGAQDAPDPLDAKLRELGAAPPHFAYAVAIVPLEGPIDVRFAGRIDAETEFESWHLLLLGTHTTLVVDALLREALDAKRVRWTDATKVMQPFGAEGAEPIDLETAYLSSQLGLPGYDRFVASAGHARPLAEVVAAHAFVVPSAVSWSSERASLRAALAQSALERAADQSWDELVRAWGRSESMPSLCDLSSTWPVRSVATGRRVDGRAWPACLSEVPAATNAGCSIDDVGRLARACLRDALGDALEERGSDLRPLRRFWHDEDAEFSTDVWKSTSEVMGATLHLELVPAHRTAIVIFATRPDRSWFEKLRRLVLAKALAIQPATSDPGLRLGGRMGRRRSTIQGAYRAEFEIDGEAIQLDIDVGLFGHAIQVKGSKRPSPLEVSGDQAWGELVLRAATDELPSKRLLVNVMRSAEDGNPLIGVVSKVSEIADEIEVERLPYPVRFVRR